MNKARFQDLPKQEQDWVDAYVDGSIEAADFEALQDRMLESPELRQVMRAYFSVDQSLAEQSEFSSASTQSATGPWLRSDENEPSVEKGKIISFTGSLIPIAAAATLAFFLGTILMHFRNGPKPVETVEAPAPVEPSAKGFAVVERLFDVTWQEQAKLHREGDMLGDEVFKLASGTAKIQFFSGATMTVEGPASIELKSAWEAVCAEGAVRMQVPPAARGFKILTPATEIIDLGTEFGLVVRDGQGHVEVLDGEIAVKHRGGAERLLKKKDALSLHLDSEATVSESGTVAFPDTSQFGSRSAEEHLSTFQRWQAHRDEVAKDPRILAYYTFDDKSASSIENLTFPRNAEFDGTVILAEEVAGRWAGLKKALEFRRPGARVRVNIPGEFSAFTFMCWTRIDSLDRQYNALFMGDGYENGEPHWQIREDGKMMLSVMVDDSKPHPIWPRAADRHHRVYFSPPMWDMTMSGKWLHLASVFDPAGKQVSHFVNGEMISSQEIEPLFEVSTLRIGNAEIGNWGLPHRQDPSFAIRHLNGRLDEVAVYKAALGADEIKMLYQRSRADLK